MAVAVVTSFSVHLGTCGASGSLGDCKVGHGWARLGNADCRALAVQLWRWLCLTVCDVEELAPPSDGYLGVAAPGKRQGRSAVQRHTSFAAVCQKGSTPNWACCTLAPHLR
jgi:hypothetical protein